jgi:hypothetical protein
VNLVCAKVLRIGEGPVRCSFEGATDRGSLRPPRPRSLLRSCLAAHSLPGRPPATCCRAHGVPTGSRDRRRNLLTYLRTPPVTREVAKRRRHRPRLEDAPHHRAVERRRTRSRSLATGTQPRGQTTLYPRSGVKRQGTRPRGVERRDTRRPSRATGTRPKGQTTPHPAAGSNGKLPGLGSSNEIPTRRVERRVHVRRARRRGIRPRVKRQGTWAVQRELVCPTLDN